MGIGKKEKGGKRKRRNEGRIDKVGIDGDVIEKEIGNKIENGVNEEIMKLVRCDDIGEVRYRGIVLLGEWSEMGEDEDMEDIIEMRNLRREEDRDWKEVMKKIDVIKKVKMGVDMDKGDRKMIVIGEKERDRDEVIEKDDEGKEEGGENIEKGWLRIEVMWERVIGVEKKIEEIERIDGKEIVEREIEVEVIKVEVEEGKVGRMEKWCRRKSMVVGELIDSIGREVRNKKKGDVGVESVEISVKIGIKNDSM